MRLVRAAALCLLGCGGQTESSTCPPDVTGAAMTIKCQEPIPILDDAVSGDPYVACRLYEAFDAGSPECACDGPGYATVSVPSTVYQELVWSEESCTPPCCPEKCVCELRQLTGSALQRCLYEPYSFFPTGWCYVNVAEGVGLPGFESQTSVCGHGLRIRGTLGKFEGFLACQD